MTFLEVKEQVSLLRVMDHFHIEHQRNSGKEMINCPFHSDKKPSCSIDYDNNQFNCFGCDAKGTIIDFVMFEKKCNNIEAKRYIEENILGEYGMNSKTRSEKIAPQNKIDNSNITDEDKKVYKAFYDKLSLSEKGFEYLHSKRGLSRKLIERWGLKSIEDYGQAYRNIMDEIDQTALWKAGLKNDEGKNVFNQPGIIIPHWCKGEIIYLQMRPYEVRRRKYIKLSKKKSAPFMGEIHDGKLIVFEGAIDAMVHSYYFNYENVISLGGLSGFDENKIRHWLKELGITSEVKICFAPDEDEPGINKAQKAALKYNNPILRLKKVCERLGIDTCKDWGEFKAS